MVRCVARQGTLRRVRARRAERLFPKDVDPSPVVLPGDFIEIDERRAYLKDLVKRYEKEVEQIDNTLRMAIADHVEAVLPSGVRFSLKL